MQVALTTGGHCYATTLTRPGHFPLVYHRTQVTSSPLSSSSLSASPGCFPTPVTPPMRLRRCLPAAASPGSFLPPLSRQQGVTSRSPRPPRRHHTSDTLMLPHRPSGMSLASRISSRYPFIFTECSVSLCMKLSDFSSSSPWCHGVWLCRCSLRQEGGEGSVLGWIKSVVEG